MSNEKENKALGIVSKILVWIVVAAAVFMMIFTIFSTLTFNKNDRSIFGMKFYIVQTDSMSLSEHNKDLDVHFNAGDIIIVENVDDPTQLNEGDIISFVSRNTDSYGETITHMIREKKYNTRGDFLGYITYGTNKGVDDEALVEPIYILGKYTGKLSGVGNFFAFVKSTPGYIICILIPFLLLILYNGTNVIRLFRKYKKEQMEEMQAERDQLDAERAENQRMMAELLALKAKLDQQDGGATSSTAPASETDSAQTESTDEN